MLDVVPSFATPVAAPFAGPERIAQLAMPALGAAGVGICAVRDGVGARVIAAAGCVGWALGRPVQRELLARLLSSPGSIQRLALDELDEISAAQLRAAGATTVLTIDVPGPDGATVGLVGAVFADTSQPGPAQSAALSMLRALVWPSLPAIAPAPQPASDDYELFVAVTSHELRTPVTVIKAYADTLRDHWDRLADSERQDAARVIWQRAGELARTVDRLLAASSVTSATIRAVPFDLADALRQATRELPVQLRREVCLDLPSKLPAALGDRATIGSVLTELITNAERYCAGGDPIQVTAHHDRRTVWFQVADRGIGISPADARLAFERYWQLKAGADRRHQGAGLGLYLIRKTIERQNGWVSLRPRDGGGTVAEVRLPRGDVEA